MSNQSPLSAVGSSSIRSVISNDRALSVFQSVVYCIVLGTWFVFFFLQPLKKEAKIMHEQQLDPTQIIAIPYDIQRLCTYVLAVVVGTLFVYFQKSFQMQIFCKVRRTLHLSAVFFLMFLLCGASVYDHLLHTFIAALYVVALSWFDPPIFYHTSALDTMSGGRRTSGRSPAWKSMMYPTYFDVVLQQLRGPPPIMVGTSSSEVRQQFILSQTIVYCCWIGTIPAQILLLYDRGYQIQRYPIPVILGSTVGWTVGVLYGTIRAFTYDCHPPE